jgi:fatty acid desaturase
VAVEALLLLLYALVLVPSVDGGRVALGVTTVTFFAAYGVGLAWAAWQLSQGQTWARAPVVLTQLIQILVGGSLWGGGTTAISVVLVVLALVVLVGVFHPQSLAALEAEDRSR